MKSPMITNLDCIANKSRYSDLQVLSSPAGYYIGTMYLNVEKDGSEWEEPGSRDSGYYRTREEAEKALVVVSALGDDIGELVLRSNP